MINIITKSTKITCFEKIHNCAIIVSIKSRAKGNTGRVITFEREIKIASNLVKVSTIS